ncbi:MAG: hypothetical protein RL264_2635 [Bacteroidota bacterium]|jgi:6-phosphogluconolactonase
MKKRHGLQNRGKMKQFKDKTTLNQELCKDIVAVLKNAISDKGNATILLSGGSSPAELYRLLSQEELDWTNVTVGLVDERFIDAESEFSNERLIKTTLIQNNAIGLKFIPMVTKLENEEENQKDLQHSYSVFNKSDCVLLGMGTDGHTASIFPNDSDSEKAILAESPIFTNAPVYPNRRITCTVPLLKSASNLFLLITGKEKLTVLESAKERQLPIAHFIENPIQIYYAD